MASPLVLDAGGGVVAAGIGVGAGGWFGLRVVAGTRGDLRRALIAAGLFAVLAFASARPPGAAPSGEGVCVGEVVDGVLRGRCRSRGPWQEIRVTVLPYAHLPQRLVSVRGLLDPGGPPRGPGLVNGRTLNRSRGVAGVLRTEAPPRVVGFVDPGPSAIRDRLRERHTTLFKGLDRHGVIAAMTTGNRRAMSRETQDAFRDAGLAHLLAISGFHVGVIGWGLYVLVGGLCIRCGFGPRGSVVVRGVITVTVVAVFAFAAGGSPSTIRAAAMAGIILGRRGLGRRGVAGMHALGLAAVAFLVLRPVGLLSAGFAMSVLAVYGLLSDVSGSRKLMVATLCAVLFTSPIAAGLFGQVVPVSLLSNLVAGPLTALVLYAALFAHLLPIGALAATAADWLAEALVWWAGTLAPTTSIPVEGFRAVLLLPVLLVGRLPRNASGRLWVTTVLLLATVLTPVLPAQRRSLEVTFLDVGQGDAILVQSPRGRTLLIDTGPPAAVGTISAALQNRAVDMTLITHPHQDHDGAVAGLERAKLLQSQSIVRARAGDTIDLDPELRIQVLAPAESPARGSPNDESVVLLIHHGRISFLLLGDAERRAEQFLTETWGPMLEADVVKVAHHGSKTSSHRFLVNRVAAESPAYAIISVASQNRFGLPDESVIQTWQETGYAVMSTAQMGSIRCTSTGIAVTCLPFAQLSR